MWTASVTSASMSCSGCGYTSTQTIHTCLLRLGVRKIHDALIWVPSGLALHKTSCLVSELSKHPPRTWAHPNIVLVPHVRERRYSWRQVLRPQEMKMVAWNGNEGIYKGVPHLRTTRNWLNTSWICLRLIIWKEVNKAEVRPWPPRDCGYVSREIRIP